MVMYVAIGGDGDRLRAMLPMREKREVATLTEKEETKKENESFFLVIFCFKVLILVIFIVIFCFHILILS